MTKRRSYSMAGLLVKLIVSPIVLLLSAFLFRDVYYPSLYQPIFVGLVLAVAGHLMEVYLLKKTTFWFMLLMDYFTAAFIIYISSFFFLGSQITWTGAFLSAFLIAITEYFQHRWLIQTNRTVKTE